jgi:hypothetical protein
MYNKYDYKMTKNPFLVSVRLLNICIYAFLFALMQKKKQQKRSRLRKKPKNMNVCLNEIAATFAQIQAEVCDLRT